MHTAPVLAVLVCHDGEDWLPGALSGLRASTVRPWHVVAVDTGSDDSTPELLADAAAGESPVVDEVVTLARRTGFAEAVSAGVAHADATWQEPDDWIWVLHDDSAVEPHCLATLLNATEASPSAGMVGPIALDWDDPRLIVEAGLTTDTSGHRRADVGIGTSTGAARGTTKEITAEQSTEVLAMPSAGVLLRRSLWDRLGGFDTELALLWDDVDFGWRANVAGSTVLCVPMARIRHARAVATGRRGHAALDAAGYPGTAAAQRAHGVRTYLVNCSRPAFVLGMPRLALLCVLRALGFLLLAAPRRARAELSGLAVVFRPAALRRGRRARVPPEGTRRSGGVRGLFVGRFRRLSRALRAGALYLVRRRVARDAALGILAGQPSRAQWVPPERSDAVAAPMAVSSSGTAVSRGMVAVPVSDTARAERTEEAGAAHGPAHAPTGESAAQRPSPGTDGGEHRLVFVEVDRKRILAATLLAPPLLLAVGLTALALFVHWHRLGLDLAGGRLLPVGDLPQVWSSYLASWHPVGGGTSAHAPPALAVLGVLGAALYPIGGPPAAVALMLVLAMPLAGLSAYVATRRLAVAGWVRALVAVGYAVLPPATAAVEQGRVGVVLAHILLPPVTAGIATVLRPGIAGDPEGTRWLPSSVMAAVGLAVLGAFSPATHILVLAGLLLAFVLVPSTVRMARRVTSMAIVALLPIALLLPWPVTLVTHPELVLHGIGARFTELPAHAAMLFSMHPGGPGALPIGAVLVVAVLVALILRPTVRALTGLGIAAIGVGGVVASQLLAASPPTGGQERHPWPGAPLLVVGLGLLAVLLAVAYRREENQPAVARVPRLMAAGAGVAMTAAFVVAAGQVGGDGPLRDADTTRLASAVAEDLARSGESVLVLRGDDDPPQQAAGGMPAFGDDDLPLPEGAAERLHGWQQAMVGAPGVPRGSDSEVRDAVAAASAAGVRMVVLPHGVDSAGLLEAGGELVSPAAGTADGRHVVRLNPAGGPVTLIAPELSRLAIGGEAPPGDVETNGVAPVEAELPEVRARVSDGAGGRLLVLAATHEAGWRAEVNGEAVPIVRAWGHQVAVEVPTRESEVLVEHPGTVRNTLLLAQLGAVLFAVLTAIPAGRKGREARPASRPR
ncbi:glycosyltransferase family 2 protein [Haloechinothrix sp. YIM 98757]|uniref:Glycosyltransferase family 2 protein n=1 Tax=Haloechinothrix aidingensis TaxID=2752311 RepID=A0A838A9K3_9PSEU|nr:glycosyltransferase family 2 protein [Haloechinothrix aidingensis]MBA0125382.1 glycosyltransferase family 2 protein [Haloechinothrix aidingensis]